MTRPRVAAAVAICVVVALLVPLTGTAAVYVGGATVVYKQDAQDPDLDRGVTVCDPAAGIGVGGGCLPFNVTAPFVEVQDLGLQLTDSTSNDGHNVAFQVCIDVDGDGSCKSGGDSPGPCADIIWFSHDDAGWFANPIGPLPITRPNQGTCNPLNRGWDGYVVFLCEGVHQSAHDVFLPHRHPATTGIIKSANFASMPGVSGNFCGGLKDQFVKDYLVA